MSDSDWIIRPAAATDTAAIAGIIRTVMPSIGACGPGFALSDPEVDGMPAAYDRPRARYFVVERGGRVQGGGGIAPLDGADEDVCELRKMYFLDELRGIGAGRALLQRCLEQAREFGFRRCYLETLPSLEDARRLYEKAGFRPIPERMGNTGHFSCDMFYLYELAGC